MRMLKDIMELKNAVFCVVLPFVLFWIGLLWGASSGSMLVYLVSMIPFYGYVYFGTNLYENTDCRNALVASAFIGVVSLVFVIVAYYAGFFPKSDYFLFVLRSSVLNAVVMMFFSFCGLLCVAFNMRWGSLWYSWPESK
ncbi:hypothetical protein [Fibrobacter sp. UWP2]|uniref:hypothetical protein n=1 Tax=Fibrobacter sp. UWP2 TaxID=1896216 RepID=UPI0009354A17|nr:hypothetical protein [Fibrobacter sp. UWP2]